MRWACRGAALLLLTAAGPAATAGAQDTTRAPRDTTARDTLARGGLTRDTLRARADSAAAARQALERQRRLADTLRAPIARAESPSVPGIGEPPEWAGEGLFATGALTLAELIEAIPGVTVFRTGFMGSPHAAAYQGRFGRVRVFYDGIELDPLDPRMGGMFDLSFVEIWQLEDARVERGPDELRVHLRSMRTRTTTPATRVDIHTGDLQTNAYRGYFSRRFPGGQALQLGGYHYSVTDEDTGGDVDHTSLWGRLGWAKGPWSVDGSILRTSRDRAEQSREGGFQALPRLDAVSTVSYARVGYREPGDPLWGQVILSTQQFTVRAPSSTLIDSIAGPDGGGPGGSPDAPDTLVISNDTTRTGPQYVFTGGARVGSILLSAAARVRRSGGQTDFAPGLRAALERPRYAVALYGERSPSDNTMRTEVSGRVLPLPYLALSGAVSHLAPVDGGNDPTTIATRAELGLRAGRVWFTGGVMMRDTVALPAPVVFDTTFRPSAAGATTATFATIRGKFYRDVGLDVIAVKYGEAGPFRPQYQTRARLYFDSDMRGRFPSGNLHILAAVTHEYRTQVPFPTSGALPLESSQYRTWGFQLEIRLLTATLSYQFRNFMNEEYEQVPGFAMPRPLNYYGVRWHFFN